MNPAETVDGTLNIASLEKKTQGSDHSNIDDRLYNNRTRHTRWHADLESLSKHQDETDIGAGYKDNKGLGRQVQGRDDRNEKVQGVGAGLDKMVQGVGTGRQHQVPLAATSQVIFQSHWGLHQTTRLVYGPKNSSDIIRHGVTQTLTKP